MVEYHVWEGCCLMTVHFVSSPSAVSFLSIVRVGTFLRLLHPRHHPHYLFPTETRLLHTKRERERERERGGRLPAPLDELLRTRGTTPKINNVLALEKPDNWNNVVPVAFVTATSADYLEDSIGLSILKLLSPRKWFIATVDLFVLRGL